MVVRPIAGGRYEILSNPEAWVATGRAGRHEVPVVIRDDLSTELAAEIVREQYGDRRAPSAIDEAQRFLDELQALGGPGRRGAISRVAAAAGRARAYVAHALRLLELPEDMQALVRQGCRARATCGHWSRCAIRCCSDDSRAPWSMNASVSCG